MDDKLKQANDNIVLLISEIVRLRKENNKGYCVDTKAQQYAMDNKTSCYNCDECSRLHYENMWEYLINKYTVE